MHAASAVGIREARTRVTGRALTRMPAVARTERMKPKSMARGGCTSTRPVTAAHRALRLTPARPLSMAAPPSAPMTPARRTEGSGPTSSTNPASAASPIPTHSRRPAPRVRAAYPVRIITTVQLDPETAVRWVSPVSFMLCASASGSWEVSPTVMPGTNPALTAPNRPDTRVRFARTVSSSPGRAPRQP